MNALQLAVELEKLVAKLSDAEKVNLAGFLDVTDECERDNYCLDISSPSFDVVCALARYIRETVGAPQTDNRYRFIIAGRSLMGDKRGLAYLTTHNADNPLAWSNHIEHAKIFTRYDKARLKVSDANHSRMVHWAFMVALPAGVGLGDVDIVTRPQACPTIGGDEGEHLLNQALDQLNHQTIINYNYQSKYWLMSPVS